MLQDARDPNNTALIELFFLVSCPKMGAPKLAPHSVDKLGQNFDTFLNRV